jgi:hypothetical protein
MNGYYIDGALISEGFYRDGRWVDAVYEQIWVEPVYEKIWVEPVYEEIFVAPEYEQILVAGRWVSSGGGTFRQEITVSGSRLSTGTLNANQQHIFTDENGFQVRITNFMGQTGMGSRWEFIILDPAGNRISSDDAKIYVKGDFMHGGNFLGLGFNTSVDGFVPFPEYNGNITHISVQNVSLEITEEFITRWIEPHYVNGELLREGHYIYRLVEEGRYVNGEILDEGHYVNGEILEEGYYEVGEWVPPVYERIWVTTSEGSVEIADEDPEDETENDPEIKIPNNTSNTPQENKNSSANENSYTNEEIFFADEIFYAPFEPSDDFMHEDDFIFMEGNNIPLGYFSPSALEISEEISEEILQPPQISPQQQLPQTGLDSMVGLFSTGLMLSVFAAAVTANRLRKRK